MTRLARLLQHISRNGNYFLSHYSTHFVDCYSSRNTKKNKDKKTQPKFIRKFETIFT